MSSSKLLSVVSAAAISALFGTGAVAQDRPDLMDVAVYSTGMGGQAPLVDGGKGKPLSGARNRIDNAALFVYTYDYDSGFALNQLSGVLEGTVPVTAAGGVTVQVAWLTNQPDKVQRAAKNAKVDQKAQLAFAARILTADGSTVTTTTGTSPNTVTNYFSWGPDVLADCSAKFSAKGVATALNTAPAKPTSAKWSAKCKTSTLTSILTSIGVPAPQQSTIATGLGFPPTDKLSVKGGY